MTRVVSVDDPQGAMRQGSSVVAEYDVPDQAWYFEQNGGVMPFAVLMEIALQPCGWLAGLHRRPTDHRDRSALP